MNLLSDEFRLALALMLLIASFAGAWRFVGRRLQTDWADRAADALLLVFVIQYASVALTGLAGILSPASITAATLAVSAILFIWPARQSPSSAIESLAVAPLDRWAIIVACLFISGFSIAMMILRRVTPIMADDAMTYHFPAAVQWLRTGRLALYETWFFNPANTYSPLAGSTLIAWWIAPVGNDLLARYIQFPALALIFFALVRLMREMCVRPIVATVVAVAIVLAQPMVRQAGVAEKDDLYLAGFFLAAVAGCSRRRLADALAPWRLGCAVGMMLATKYTALLVAPALLLTADAPWRARWRGRSYAIAAGLVVLLAGPWYLRNWIMAGNPLYPMDVRLGTWTIFKGLFSTSRSAELVSLPGIWKVLTARHQSLPPLPLIVGSLAWIAACIVRFGKIRSDPLVRTALLAPPLLLVLFAFTSPYPEARFVYPALLLVFASAGLAIPDRVSRLWAPLGLAAVLVLCSAGTGLAPEHLILFTAGGIVAVISGLAYAGLLALLGRPTPARPGRRREFLAYSGLVGAAVIGLAIYTLAPRLVGEMIATAPTAWEMQHGDAARVWEFIDEKLPPAETLAYTNTHLVLPLTGPLHERPIVYVPTRRGVRHLSDLPHIDRPLSGEQIVPAITQATFADPDPAQWLDGLSHERATHVAVFVSAGAAPPELAMIASRRDRFELVFENPAGKVYRLK